jgi:hypothetical protein
VLPGELGKVPAIRERRLHLLLEAAGVQAIDVVVAVVRKQEAAVLHEPPQLVAFLVSEANQLVAGHEQERERQQLVARGGNDHLVGIDGDAGVFENRIEDVCRDLRVIVPVPRVVAEPREHEFGRPRPSLSGRLRRRASLDHG